MLLSGDAKYALEALEMETPALPKLSTLHYCRGGCYEGHTCFMEMERRGGGGGGGGGLQIENYGKKEQKEWLDNNVT